MSTATPDRTQSWQCIPDSLTGFVSAACDVSHANVMTDARDVAIWLGSNAELLRLIDTRRGLGGASSAAYLRLLRTALDIGTATVSNRLLISRGEQDSPGPEFHLLQDPATGAEFEP